MTETKVLSIMGSTGSIGTSALSVVAHANAEGDRPVYKIDTLAAGRDVDGLARQAVEFGARMAVIGDSGLYGDLKSALSGTGISVAAGADAVDESAARPVHRVVAAIVGIEGLSSTLAAIDAGNSVALANKESMVCAGPLMLETAKRHGATILPVDSEHSAVFQALIGEDMAAVERVIITASGGAFRDWPLEALEHATPEQAATHPNWDMGQRITIDSASMFNKAMELIETKEFFNVPPEMIEVLVHRESLIHAMVGFHDGALMAHVGPPDMRHAIGYALHWPERENLPVERLDLAKIGSLTFEAPDEARYPALRIAKDVMAAGGLSGAVFNAAKERALDGFIAGEIGFLDMSAVVAITLDKMSSGHGLQSQPMTLDNVLETDRLARIYAGEAISTLG